MSRSPRNFFGWSQDGVGLRVSADRRSDFAHEVITQDDLVHLDGPVFLGAAQPRWRFIAAIVVALVAATGLITRAFWMQIVEGPAYAERAERNRLRADVVPARRELFVISTVLYSQITFRRSIWSLFPGISRQNQSHGASFWLLLVVRLVSLWETSSSWSHLPRIPRNPSRYFEIFRMIVPLRFKF
jgi:hypothetical protein